MPPTSAPMQIVDIAPPLNVLCGCGQAMTCVGVWPVSDRRNGTTTAWYDCKSCQKRRGVQL